MLTWPLRSRCLQAITFEPADPRPDDEEVFLRQGIHGGTERTWRCLMRRSTLIVALLALSSLAFADSSDLADGVFIAHYAPSLAYTTDTPEGGWGAALQSSPDSIRNCEDQNNRIDGRIDHAMWFIISAWSEDKVWCTTQVGMEVYDPGVWLFQDNGPVYPGGGSGLEIYTNAFPSGDPVGGPSGVIFGPEGGSWGPTNFEPVWWFEGYAYSSGYGTTLLQLGEDPATQFGGWFNCENPPGEFVASDFGAMGVNRAGVYACPGSEEDGWGDDAEDGEDEDGGTAVCCYDGTCQITTEEECDALGGGYYPEWVSCSPNPCVVVVTLDGSIQAAIDAVGDGMAVELTDGRFIGDGNHDIRYWGKEITVRSISDDPELCMIDCDWGGSPSRGFLFWDYETPRAKLRGVTVRGARAGGGYP
jgi:hypothetical protein